MNTTSHTPAATFAEFLARPEISDEIGNLHCSLGDSGVQFPADTDDLIYTVSSSDTDDEELLYDIDALADKFADAACQMRSFISSYLDQRGALKQASDAIERFAAEPIEVNRAALEQASETLDGYHFITMPRALKGKLRPFVTSRQLKSRINFGSLNRIARSYLKVETPVKEAP